MSSLRYNTELHTKYINLAVARILQSSDVKSTTRAVLDDIADGVEGLNPQSLLTSLWHKVSERMEGGKALNFNFLWC